MTMRTIDVALQKIDKRNHNTFAMRAALHGIRIEPRMPAEESADLSEEQERVAESALRAAMDRKKAELNRG